MRSSIAAVVGLTVALSLATVALAGGGGTRSAAPSMRIADVSTTGLRVVVTATRRGNEAPPTARVAVSTFKRAAGSWSRTERHVLPGTYFWHTVTGPRAVCRLDLRGGSPAPSRRPRLVIQLLTTPSIGCGRAHELVLDDR
jgi:hypothetical protein